MNTPPKKYIVFDVDETLGYFTQFGLFLHALEMYFQNHTLIYSNFIHLLDLYPEFIRPHMFAVLKYIHNMRADGTCDGMFIYTNNQAPRSWVIHITKFLEYKCNVKNMFDRIIAAYKINGKLIELGRSRHDKCFDDLVNVTKIEPNSEVCFVDDMLHTRMQLKNIFYIHVLPYIAFLPVDVMIERVLKSEFGKQHINPLEHSHFASIVKLHMGDIKYLHDLHSNSSFISMYNRTSTINKISEFKVAGKKLLSYIKYFLKHNMPITSMSSRKSSTVKTRYKKKVKWCTKRRFP
jgi:hypothetical protein